MNVYTSEAIRRIDQTATEQGFSLFALMENAGRGIAQKLQSNLSKNEHILILAGRGNNGGDGIVIARYLRDAGYAVTLTFPLGTPKTETASAHLAYYEKQYDSTVPWEATMQPDVIIDALLGVGVTPPLRENAAKLVAWANEQPARRYAIDLPTGVSADEGETVETAFPSTPEVEATTVHAFQAQATFALHGAKPSAFLLPSSHYYGKVLPVAIGLPQTSKIAVTSEAEVRAAMPKRGKTSHKGTFGTSFLLAGSDEMPGSAMLAAIGAIRCGTGLLVMGTTRFAASMIGTRVPEAMYQLEGLMRAAEGDFPAKMNAIGIGPGLSDKRLIERALDQLIATKQPLVVDAGALLPDRNWKRSAPTVLTPHPGEFSKLTDLSIASIQANRITEAQQFAETNDVILVLKGSVTVIAFPNGTVRLNPTGNSGLAKGGSGDVLTGMITAMLGFYDNPHAAVTNAVYLHGRCADYWSETNSEAAMTASDMETVLPRVLRRLEATDVEQNG